MCTHSIRASRDIKGIQIANREIKFSQYADDTAIFARMRARLETAGFIGHI